MDAEVLEVPAVDSAAETQSDTPAETETTVETKTEGKKETLDSTKETKQETAETKPAVNAELAGRAKSAVAKVGELFDALKNFAGTNVLSESAEAEIDEVKALITEVAEGKFSGANEAHTKEITDLKSEVAAVEASDKLLYATDRASHRTLAENIRTDIQNENGDLAAYHDFAGAVIDDLKTAEPEAFWKNVGTPLFQEALRGSGFVNAVSTLVDAFNSKDNKAAGSTLQKIVDYINRLDETAADTKREAPDTKVMEQQTAISTEALRSARSVFTKIVLPMFNTNPALKALDADDKQDLSVALLREYRAQMSSDTMFQKTMKALWKDPAKNKVELLKTHNEKLNKIAKTVVDKVLKTRYPKSVATAGSTASGTFIKTPQGKALWLTKKPEDLDRTVKGADVLEIAGRGYRKGSQQLVAWRKPI